MDLRPTRRQLLAAVVVGTAGCGREEPMTERIGTPKHDHSGDGHGGGALTPDSVEVQGEAPFRLESYDSPVTLYCDPVNGDDSNPGTKAEPLATLQAAGHRTARFPNREVEIDLASAASLPVTYNEDVILGPFFAAEYAPSEAINGNHSVLIQGDPTTPSNVEVGSAVVVGGSGQNSPVFDGIRTLNDTPHHDSNAGIVFIGNYGGQVKNAEFRNANTGFIAYGSQVRLADIDIGASVLGTGIVSKRNSQIHATGALSGQATGNDCFIVSNSRINFRDSLFGQGEAGIDTQDGAEAWISSNVTGFSVNRQVGDWHVRRRFLIRPANHTTTDFQNGDEVSVHPDATSGTIPEAAIFYNGTLYSQASSDTWAL